MWAHWLNRKAHFVTQIYNDKTLQFFKPDLKLFNKLYK